MPAPFPSRQLQPGSPDPPYLPYLPLIRWSLAASQTIVRLRPLGYGGRKVRTPQGSAPGNARSGQLEGQWHRKHTAPPEPARAKASKGEKVR